MNLVFDFSFIFFFCDDLLHANTLLSVACADALSLLLVELLSHAGMLDRGTSYETDHCQYYFSVESSSIKNKIILFFLGDLGETRLVTKTVIEFR